MRVMPYKQANTVPSFVFPEDAALWREACTLREHYWGKNVFLRGIVEISNHCRQNCLYCGLRRDNTALQRYRMAPDIIFASAQAVQRLGFGSIVLQAGEDPGFSANDIAILIRRIKKELGLAVTLSFGEWEKSVYALWRDAGADRYLLKLETADEKNYTRLRPGNSLSQRIEAFCTLMSLGYETGSGFITDLPGNPEDALSKGLTLLSGYKPDMLSLSPFVPHPETPLRGHAAGGIATHLRLMATARTMMPAAHIPVTSALGLQGDAVRLAALEVGNVLMPSLTPQEVRRAYAIYPGKNMDAEEPEQRAARFRPMLEASGFEAPIGAGSAWRLQYETTRRP